MSSNADRVGPYSATSLSVSPDGDIVVEPFAGCELTVETGNGRYVIERTDSSGRTWRWTGEDYERAQALFREALMSFGFQEHPETRLVDDGS